MTFLTNLYSPMNLSVHVTTLWVVVLEILGLQKFQESRISYLILVVQLGVLVALSLSNLRDENMLKILLDPP